MKLLTPIRPGRAALVAALMGVAGPLHAATRLLAVRVDAIASTTTVQLSLSHQVTPHVFSLEHPDRLVVDLPATRAASRRWPVSAGAVLRVRAAPRAGGTLRVVFDLKPGLRYTGLHSTVHSQPRGGNYQLQLELAPTATATTVAASATATSASPVGAPAIPVSVNTTPAAPERPEVVRAQHAPRDGQRDIIIAVDAGHGGQDPGATGADGTHEKDVVLAIAKTLAARIDRASGMRAVLTRDGDYFISLRERMRRARLAHADMFVSIHADSVRDRDVAGSSVYILSERGATNEAARLLADNENAADLKGGVSLADQGKLASVLLDLSQSANIGASVDAADDVLTALDRVGAVRKHQVLQAAFVVLKSPDIPSMLVETAYISNPAEERKLGTPQQQRRLADAIFSGVQTYFHLHPPDGTLYAYERGSSASGGGEVATLARNGG